MADFFAKIYFPKQLKENYHEKLEYCKYTYRHRKAFYYVVNKIIKDETIKKEMLKRARFHDLDKMTLYMFFEKKMSSQYHRNLSSHHLENNLPKTFYDYLESIIDFECAGYTKPDKPLNAYDTIEKIFKNQIDSNIYNSLVDILREYNLNSSYCVLNDHIGLEYLKKYKNVTEEMIIYEVLDYINNFKNNSFTIFQKDILKIIEKGEFL